MPAQNLVQRLWSAGANLWEIPCQPKSSFPFAVAASRIWTNSTATAALAKSLSSIKLDFVKIKELREDRDIELERLPRRSSRARHPH
jgi:hypothetical protein